MRRSNSIGNERTVAKQDTDGTSVCGAQLSLVLVAVGHQPKQGDQAPPNSIVAEVALLTKVVAVVSRVLMEDHDMQLTAQVPCLPPRPSHSLHPASCCYNLSSHPLSPHADSHQAITANESFRIAIRQQPAISRDMHQICCNRQNAVHATSAFGGTHAQRVTRR